MNFETINMGGYNLHLIKTNKFKTITIDVDFYRNIKKEEITERNLLKMVLLDSSNNYKTERDLIIESENLYDIKVSSSISRIGNFSNLSFQTKFLNEKYTEKDMNKESIIFFLDLIFNPYVKDNTFVSIDNQKRQCIEFAEKQGYSVTKVFVDEGKSAKNLERPEIQELMAYCSKKKNKISAVIIWRLDRISRNTEDYHGVLRPLFEKQGIKLLSATEANVNTIEGDLMRNIGMSFAEYERKVIGARTIAGLRQKAELGEYPHKAPIGYKNISKEDGSKTIIIDDSCAFYIKQAFNLYDSGFFVFS